MPLRWLFLLTVLLCLASRTLAQSDRAREAARLADKLWRILDITKQYQPQFQAHVTLEAPDGERLAQCGGIVRPGDGPRVRNRSGLTRTAPCSSTPQTADQVASASRESPSRHR